MTCYCTDAGFGQGDLEAMLATVRFKKLAVMHIFLEQVNPVIVSS